MSELLQSGQHPDADQLNAFVEHTLPAHEQQQTLAHLAVCSDCRTIVSLSLPPIDELPKPQPEPVRRPWYFGWSLILPAAAAFAALVVIIYIRNSASITPPTAPSQMAVSQPPASLPVPETSSIPASKSLTLIAPKTQRSSPPLASSTEADVRANRQGGHAVVDGQNLVKLPTEGRNFTDLAQPPASPTRSFHGAPHASAKGASGFLAGASTVNSQAPAGRTPDRVRQNASAVALGSLIEPPAPTPAPPMPITEHASAAAAPSAVPSAPAMVGTVNQTVEVSNANGAPIATLSSTNDNVTLEGSKSILVQYTLPSNLPTLSVVSTARQILAIDTRNALFFSEDGGLHWKAIPSPWQGRAVKVDLISGANTLGRSASANATPQPAASFGAIGGPILSSRAQPTNSTLSGTVTDPSGAAIGDASVAISNAAAPIIRSVKTDRAGHYLVDGLAPGVYQVQVQATGFSMQQSSVTLADSQRSLANFTLPIGQAAETVTVDASAASPTLRSLAKKKTAEPAPLSQPVFAITTDTGERWTSIDGQTWKHN
jgi:hypothetical protein